MLSRIDFDLASAVGRACNRARAVVDASSAVELHFSRPVAPVVVSGFPAGTERLVEGLLENAYQSMDGRPGTVSVTLEVGSDRVVLVVRDQGVGISAERIPGMFLDFRSGRREGFGTGLAMVHAYVQAMGGEIAVESELGLGTVFRVAMPLV